MIRAWKNLRFSGKLMLVFCLSLSLTILLITMRQISKTYQLLEEKSTDHLQMLTEQVTLNFGESQKSIATASYSSMVAFEIPKSMGRDYSLASLRTGLAMMVKVSDPYDYIMVRTQEGDRLDTGTKYHLKKAEVRLIEQDCNTILDQHTKTSYGITSWIRTESGEVYLLRDVYDISPLQHVGTMVLHMRHDFFDFSSTYPETGFLFFDKNKQFITCTNMDLPDAVLDAIVTDFEDGELSSKGNWSGEEYFVAQSVSDGWHAVGVMSTYTYRQGCNRIFYENITFGTVCLLLGVLLVYVLNLSELRKLKELNISMKEIAKGNFGYQIQVSDSDDISQLAVTFNYMSHHISELLQQLVEKERMRSNAELQVLEYKYRALETQIRPHFIYNALETINAMAKMKGETDIVEAVHLISRYFRSITLNTTHQFITVQQEFDNLQDYTQIYRMIHGERLRTTFSARENARSAMVPTMILQPIVENAMNYGLQDQNQESEVRVHAYAKNGKLFLTVKDRGCGLTPEQTEQLENGQILSRSKHTGIGLSNVRERLQLIYGEESNITLRNRRNGGVKVTIEIPFAYSEPDDMDELDDLDDWDDLDDLDDWDLL